MTSSGQSVQRSPIPAMQSLAKVLSGAVDCRHVTMITDNLIDRFIIILLLLLLDRLMWLNCIVVFLETKVCYNSSTFKLI